MVRCNHRVCHVLHVNHILCLVVGIDGIVDVEDDIEDQEEMLFRSIFDQIKNSRSKRSGSQFKRMYNVEMLRKLSGGLFDMSYLGQNQFRRQEQEK